MRKFIISNLLLLMFLVGAASGFFLSNVAWWSLHSSAQDLGLVAVAVDAPARAAAFEEAMRHNRDAGVMLAALATLATALFCAIGALTWRQAMAGRAAAQALGRDHTLFKNLFDGTRDGILMLSGERIVDCNPAALRLFGATAADQLCGADLAALYPERQPDGTLSRQSWPVSAERFDWQFTRPEGDAFAAEVSSNTVTIGHDRVTQLIVRDISARKLAESQMRLANQAFEASLEGIAITDAHGDILSINGAFSTVTGYPPEEVIGRNPRMLSSGRHGPEFYQEMWEALETKQQWQGEIWNIRKNGEVYPQWLNISRVRDEHGKVTNFVGVFSDISELKAAHARNLYAIYHDQLTMLPNRVLLTDRLIQLAATAAGVPGQQIGVMYMDVDRLKVVNDSMGREAGDMLLRMVAVRLQGAIRASDTLARMNGNEFAVLLTPLEHADDAPSIARHILRSFDDPFALNGELLHVSLSIGISIYPTDGHDAENLLQSAAMAMYRAKQAGGTTYELYDEQLGAQASRRLAIETGLRQAVERNEMELYYQPQFACESGELLGFEALLRWNHPQLGLIEPDVFLAVAEETGSIVPIGAWVLQTACAQAQAWRRDAGHDCRRLMAVNLSARQLRHPTFVQHVISALDDSGLPAHCLELEVTESMMMQDMEICIDVMHRLAALGVEFSIDDFGTGYSSLAYLKRMPFKALKIDRSFIQDIATDPEGASIVSAIVAMSSTLGLRVVAEGIEDHAQLAHLKGYADIIGQGFLLGRPVDAGEAGALVRKMACLEDDCELLAVAL